MDVIADFPAYPTWAQGVRLAQVRVPGAAGERARQVYFEIDADPDPRLLHPGLRLARRPLVTWSLAEGKMMKAIDGVYELDQRGDGTPR